MFSKFFESLTARESRGESLAADESQIALATLLVRLARVDDTYDPEERIEIDLVLAERFGLDKAAAAALRTRAEEEEAEAPDTVRFTRTLKETVPYEDRLGLVEALWKVALADGDRDNAENNFLRLVVSLLGVSDRDSGAVRHEVQQQMGR